MEIILTLKIVKKLKIADNSGMGYQRQAIFGMGWTGSLRLMVRGAGFVRTAFLARLLTPAEFGIFGIASLMLGLLEMLTETGVNVVLIQEKGDEATEKYLNTAWITSIGRGLLIGVLMIAGSPLIAHFFNKPRSLPILLAISLVPMIRGFINPAIVNFQKRLRFDQEFKFRSGLTAIEAVVSITFAFLTHSPVSLVIGLLVSAVAEVIFSFVFITPTPVWSFEVKKFRYIIKRGIWITFTGTVNYLYLNGPDMVIGKLLSAASLGFYQMAFRFGFTPVSELGDASNRVTFPIYVNICGDKSRTRRAFYKNVASLLLSMAPIILALILLPKLIVTIFLGDQWLPVIPLLPPMGIAVAIAALTAPISSLLLAQKQQRHLFYLNLFRTTVLLIIVVPLINRFGTLGGCYALLGGALISLPYAAYITRKALV